MPPYFKQEYRAACNLTCLRMALANYGIEASEAELMRKVEPDYGKNYDNIWNPTVAKLACEYGIKTAMYALWPLFKKPLLEKALAEFKNDPEGMDINRYENPDDHDEIPESLRLAYTEMFEAVELGCKTVYGTLTPNRIRQQLSRGSLIQTTIRLQDMYPDKNITGYHVVLLYEADGSTVTYHDPFHGPSLTCTFEKLIEATTDVGVAMVFAGIDASVKV